MTVFAYETLLQTVNSLPRLSLKLLCANNSIFIKVFIANKNGQKSQFAFGVFCARYDSGS